MKHRSSLRAGRTAPQSHEDMQRHRLQTGLGGVRRIRRSAGPGLHQQTSAANRVFEASGAVQTKPDSTVNWPGHRPRLRFTTSP